MMIVKATKDQLIDRTLSILDEITSETVHKDKEDDLQEKKRSIIQ